MELPKTARWRHNNTAQLKLSKTSLNKVDARSRLLSTQANTTNDPIQGFFCISPLATPLKINDVSQVPRRRFRSILLM